MVCSLSGGVVAPLTCDSCISSSLIFPKPVSAESRVSSIRKKRKCSRIEYMVCSAAQHLEEHFIAALRPLHDHGGGERHVEKGEAVKRVMLHHLLEGVVRHAILAQLGVIFGEKVLLMLAANIALQRTAEEIGDIGHAAAVANRLPVHHR